jgi:glyoxylase-like metal-dependent hydrolase (beta-lactamase superfamily II)
MSEGAAHFPVFLGDFACAAMGDGSMDYPPAHLFTGVDREVIEARQREANLPVDYIRTPYTQLLVDTGRQKVLIDAGAGRIAPTTGFLTESLAEAGMGFSDVDIVIITHAHPAHVGGLLDEAGKPAFRSAQHIVSRTEWEFWTSEVAFQRAPARQVAIARRCLEGVRELLTFAEDEGEVLPGIRLVPAPGHTPGHAVVSLTSGAQRLLYIADTVFHTWQVEHPNWRPIYDVGPEQAEASRRSVLGLAARKDAIVMGHHIAPFPGLGQVAQMGEGWTWQAL